MMQSHANPEAASSPRSSRAPPALDFHTTVVSPDGASLFVFGGSDGILRQRDVFLRRLVYTPPSLVVLAARAVRAKIRAGTCMRQEFDGLPEVLRDLVVTLNPTFKHVPPVRPAPFMPLLSSLLVVGDSQSPPLC